MMMGLVNAPKRCIVSNWTFQKGKLNMKKLKDKATIDESIDQVNVIFPDQFGRLTGMKLNAEYFIEAVQEANNGNENGEKPTFFEFKHNPFRFDIHGKPINFSQASCKDTPESKN